MFGKKFMANAAFFQALGLENTLKIQEIKFQRPCEDVNAAVKKAIGQGEGDGTSFRNRHKNCG